MSAAFTPRRNHLIGFVIVSDNIPAPSRIQPHCWEWRLYVQSQHVAYTRVESHLPPANTLTLSEESNNHAPECAESRHLSTSVSLSVH